MRLRCASVARPGSVVCLDAILMMVGGCLSGGVEESPGYLNPSSFWNPKSPEAVFWTLNPVLQEAFTNLQKSPPPSSIIMTPNSWSHTHASLHVPSALHTWLSQAAFSNWGSQLTCQRARGQGSSGPARLPVLLWVSAPQSTPSALQCSTPLSPPSGVTAPCLLPSVPMSLAAAQPLIFEVLWLRSVRGLSLVPPWLPSPRGHTAEHFLSTHPTCTISL